MSINRVIHTAVRRDLDRFTTALNTLDDDRRRAKQLAVAWANFHQQLTIHHSSEHRIAWPALRTAGLTDELITELDGEHDRMAAVLESADQAMRTLPSTPNAENVRAAREAVATLRTIAIEHLDHEEAQLEPFLLDNKHTPAMKAMSRAFAREYRPLPKAGTFFAWLQDGATSDERAGLRQNVPGPVVAIIGRVFGGNYHRSRT